MLEALLILLSLILISFFTYHFQIKEYRWDRMYVAILEQNTKLLFPERFLIPAKTPRNFLIMLIGTVIVFISTARLNGFLSILLPLIAVISIGIGVFFTQPI